MATDFINCNNWLNEAVIKSLINDGSALAADYSYGFRILEIGISQTDPDPIPCNSETDFWNLFSKALAIGDDNKIVLRVINTTVVDGVGLTNVPACGQNETLWLMLSKCFRYATDGGVAFQLWNIT